MSDWYSDLTDRENDGAPELRRNDALHEYLRLGGRLSDFHRHNQKPTENSMKIGEHIRQGDTLLRKVATIPAVAKEMKRDAHGRIVLAEGERTGHAHTFRDKGICSFSVTDENDVAFLLVGGSGATLKHELVSGAKAEHDAITIGEGNYEAAQQMEYSPAALQRVTD